MKKSKIPAVLIIVCFMLSACVSIAGAAAGTFKSIADKNYAINRQSVWDPLNSFKFDSKMKNYYLGFQDNELGISVGADGKVYYTGDSGNTWIAGKNSSKSLYGLEIVDYSTAWACGKGGTVVVTKDAGKTWAKASNFGSADCKYISFADDKNGWVASAKKLASTADSGKKWKEIKLPQGARDIAAIKVLATESDYIVGYILDSQGYLFITSNNGKTWTKKDVGLKKLKIANGLIPLQDSPTAVVCFQSENVGIIAFSGIIAKKPVICDLRTFDRGKTWIQYIMPCKYNSPSLYVSNNLVTLTLSEKSKGAPVRTAASTYFNQLADAVPHHL